MGASSRVRFLQFIDRFEKSNSEEFHFDIVPLLEDSYLEALYANGSRSKTYLLRQYLKRCRRLLSCGQYDLVWIEKEIFPGLPALAERLMSALGVRMLVDYDDATFVWYRNHPNWFVRNVLGRKIDVVMRTARCVVVGNDFLAGYAQGAGARRLAVVPSVVDLSSEPHAKHQRVGKEGFTVGWIGTPSTARYLEIFADCLRDLTTTDEATFLTIGAPSQLLSGVRQQAYSWSEATEGELLERCDVAIAPLSAVGTFELSEAVGRHDRMAPGSWERGKCAFKVVKSMAAALPVVASPVGMAREIITHGENGFFAEGSEDCGAILRRLKADVRERRRIGQAARHTVERLFSASVVEDDLRAALLGAMHQPGASRSMAANALA
jgi:glycosyltransferase involved in cell wall biosynthesis